MRKLMYASLMPHLKRGAKETDIIQFDFEQKTIETISDEEMQIMEKEIEAVKDFWAIHDAKKNKC